MRETVKLVIVLAALLLLLPAWGPARAAGPVKIGIIDLPRIMRDAQAAKDARGVLAKELESRRAQLMAKDKELKAMDGELKNPQLKLSEAARKEKTEKLAREIKEFRRLDADFGEELKKKEVELTQKIIGEIRGIVQSLIKNEKYTLILEKGGVFGSDEAVDVTERVLRLYDRQR
ncbi:MAG: OmpH family outer membrane protein [Pseudomonadota bacterium]|nr:OmpH family outer membrane protein [Pseudomonadota bacterium]